MLITKNFVSTTNGNGCFWCATLHVANLNKAHTSFSDTRVTMRVILVVQVKEVFNQLSLFSCFKSFVVRTFH